MAHHIWTGTTSGDYSVAGNWIGGVPVAAGDVTIQGSVSITAGLNQSAVAVDRFIVDPTYSGALGSLSLGYLQVDPDSFEYEGGGLAFIDIGAAAIAPTIRKTAAAPAVGAAGLYLKGTAMTTLNLIKGTVGLAIIDDEVSTVATINNTFLSTQGTDANIIIGQGVTLTTLNQTGGTVDLRCAATTINASGGTLTTRGTGAITTVNNTGATIYPTSTGTITTLNANGGTTDFMRNRTARTVTTLAVNPITSTVIFDSAFLTVTNGVTYSGPVRIVTTRV